MSKRSYSRQVRRNVINSDGAEKVGDEDIDKEDKELDKFVLYDWENFILHFIGFVVYLIFATCLSIYSNTYTVH